MAHLKECPECGGSGLTWILQMKNKGYFKRNVSMGSVHITCRSCNGVGSVVELGTREWSWTETICPD